MALHRGNQHASVAYELISAVNGHAETKWWALVGPMTGPEPAGYITTAHDAFRVLRNACSVGPLELRPGDRQLIEYIPRLDAGWMEAVSWPIVVNGESSVSGKVVDLRQASRDLHRLCCLLSLAWFEAWQVRIAPRLVAQGAPNVPDPIVVPSLPDLRTNPQIGHQDPTDVPEWIFLVWDRLDESEFGLKCLPSVSIWHEGIILQAEHPSLSFVAYVASVEQAAHLIVPDAAQRSDSGRFWAAVKTVASPEEMALLKEINPYGKRSATGHGSGLHGIESEFGHMLLPPIGPGDPTYDFVFGHLRQMARISREVLLRALKGGTVGSS